MIVLSEECPCFELFIPALNRDERNQILIIDSDCLFIIVVRD